MAVSCARGNVIGEMLIVQGLTEDDVSHFPARKNFAAYGRPMALVSTTWDRQRVFVLLSNVSGTG